MSLDSKENPVKNLLNREPAMVMAALQAAVALVTVFGLNLSAEQIGAIMGFSAAVLGLIVRNRVTPVAKG